MKEKVITVLQEIRPEFDFRNETGFIENGMLDSLDIINLVVALDSTFGISIDGLDISPDNFSGLESIVSLLKKNGAADES
jgi:acyl carrier protein